MSSTTYVWRDGKLVEKASLSYNPAGPVFHKFPEGVFRDITPDDVYVHDKPHLRRLIDQHGAYAPGLIDGATDVTEF